jgi:hypothetical protein
MPVVAAGESITGQRWGGRRRGEVLRSALTDAVAVFATAGRLIAAHWPVLIALGLAGYIGRELAMRAAARASDINGVLGFLVLVFAPLSTLTALVLMLRTLRSSLPWLRMASANSTEATVVAGGRPRTLFNYLGSVLVPFLAVYASYGYLKQDISDYVYRVLMRQNYFEKVDIFRHLPFTLGTTLITVVVVAIGLRWLLSRFEGKPHLAWLGIFGAYVEVLWITLVAATITQFKGSATTWVEDRRAVHWIQDGWGSAVEKFGPLAAPARSVVSWLGETLGSVDAVIVVPLAWLTVGAVVYGHTLAPPSPSGSVLFMRAARKWLIIPRPLRRVGSELTADFRDRFTPLVHGLRLVVRAGLAPMLLFCLAFLVAQAAGTWLWELERLIIGPQDINVVWRAVDGPLSVFNDLVATVLLACLLSAAVDRVLRADRPAPGPRADRQAPGPQGDPARPVDPASAAPSSEPAQPAWPAQSVQPASPVQLASPTQAAQPAWPAQSVQPAFPVQPPTFPPALIPAIQPVQIGQPANIVQPMPDAPALMQVAPQPAPVEAWAPDPQPVPPEAWAPNLEPDPSAEQTQAVPLYRPSQPAQSIPAGQPAPAAQPVQAAQPIPAPHPAPAAQPLWAQPTLAGQTTQATQLEAPAATADAANAGVDGPTVALHQVTPPVNTIG